MKYLNHKVGEKFKDVFEFTATDGNGGFYKREIKAASFKDAATFLQSVYHSVLSLKLKQ